jgi:hypothetical protein
MRLIKFLVGAGLAISACAPAALEREQALRLPTPRATHASVVLPDGRVLLIGGCVAGSCDAGPASATADVFNPASGTVQEAGRLTIARIGSGAVALGDGRVLIVGGWSGSRPTDTAEIFDPATGRSRSVGRMSAARADAGIVMLGDGRVLVAGGYDGERRLASADVFDPKTERFEKAGAMLLARSGAATAALPDGRILVAGGAVGAGRETRPTAAAELFDPNTMRFSRTGDMNEARYKHAAVTLQDARVLVIAGSDERDYRGKKATLEIYDAKRGTFRPAGQLRAERFKLADAVVPLPDGKVLIAGGAPRPELYDPRTGRSELVDLDLGGNWNFMTADRLPDGRVLLAGGYREASIELSDRAWLLRL